MEIEWTHENTRNLICLYEQKRCLWDYLSEDYKHKSRKQKAFDEIGNFFQTSAEIVQKKIRLLRIQYNRELVKLRNSTPDDMYVSKWWAFKLMHRFLKHAPRIARTIIGKMEFSESTPDYNYGNDEEDEDDDQIIKEEHNLEHNVTVEYKDPALDTNPMSSKKCLEIVVPETINANYSEDIDREKMHVDKNETFPKPSKFHRPIYRRNPEDFLQINEDYVQSGYTRDEFSVFGEYVANELRKVTDNVALATAKHKISQALFEAQMIQFSSSSSHYNHSNCIQCHNTKSS